MVCQMLLLADVTTGASSKGTWVKWGKSETVPEAKVEASTKIPLR